MQGALAREITVFLFIFVAQAFFDLMRLIREKKDENPNSASNKKVPSSSKDKKDKKSKRKCTIL